MPFEYPADRYYYGWYADPMWAAPTPVEPTDHEIKATVVERLHQNPYTANETIRVDVKRNVVILTGDVSSVLAKRAAGDDAWDTPAVVDVSNQLAVRALTRSRS